MKERIVKLVYPSDKASEKQAINLVRSFVSRVTCSEEKSIYDAVEVFQNHESSESIKSKLALKRIKNRISLRDIVNLHNDDGIRDLSQIKQMVQKVKSRESIFTPEGLPNIKLVKTENVWVLFDGHHSMLAYMFTGKEFLDEIPHLIILNGKNKGVNNQEIHVFFGKHASKLKDKSWQDFVINWEAPEVNQVQKRRQRNMGELFDSLIDKIK